MRVRIRRFERLRFPERADLSAAVSFVAGRAYPTSPPRWASPAGFRRELRFGLRGHLWSTTEIRNLPSPFRSVLHDWGGPHSPKPVASMTAADFSLRRRQLPAALPFRA